MYRLIVVEDEDIVRNGIVNGSPLNELGFTVVAEAVDGYDALDKVKELRPDVVLTDIKMPR